MIGSLTRIGIGLAENGRLPDTVVRWAIRGLCRKRLDEIERDGGTDPREAHRRFVERMEAEPLAKVPEKANEQHYEVPAGFFKQVLGRHLKYSSGWWPEGVTDLDTSEEAALAATAERALLEDGQDVLDIGCGWGSLTLWMAARFPASRITAVSNSASQREFILARAAERGLENVRVVTADMNGFEPGKTFDRIVSVEMFEHVRRHRELMQRISRWLRPGGRLFVHVFCHRTHSYTFEDGGHDDWMGRHFFSGGIMPGEELLPAVAGKLTLEERWRWDGSHYQRTSEAWLRNLDSRRSEVLAVFRDLYGQDEARRWLGRWRIFFLACAELFGFDGGKEWGVTHYRFRAPGPGR